MEATSTVSTDNHSHSVRFPKPRYQLKDVFNRYLQKYLSTHKLSYLQDKVVTAIRACRTAELGGHIEICDNQSCAYTRHHYNSCGNRHCPTCQGSNRFKWVKQRLEELLPIPYYHCVFTMVHDLNDLALYNKEVIYGIFFKAAAHTLNAFAQDPRFLGAKIGFIGVLHTWGQKLNYHVHLHFIVTGGGISNDGTRWVRLPYENDFLFPVKAMSRRMRKKFAEWLEGAYNQGKLVFPDTLSHLSNANSFKRFLNKIAWQNWNIYAKEPFAGPEEVVKYIGRYTHRVAISNHRLLDIEDGEVSFRYKKYKDNKVTWRTMSLKADEFIRRFLLHVIPGGFKRIRHFGFFGPGCRTHKIQLVREWLNAFGDKLKQAKSAFDDVVEKLDPLKCPMCKIGTMRLLEVIPPLHLVPG